MGRDCDDGPGINDDGWKMAHWLPILHLFINHDAKFDRRPIDLAFKKLYRTQSGWLDKERAFVILDSVASGLDDLSMEYARGENHVTAHKKAKEAHLKRIESGSTSTPISPTSPNTPA